MHGLGSEREQEMPDVFTDEFIEWFEREYEMDIDQLLVEVIPWGYIPLDHWEEEDCRQDGDGCCGTTITWKFTDLLTESMTEGVMVPLDIIAQLKQEAGNDCSCTCGTGDAG